MSSWLRRHLRRHMAYHLIPTGLDCSFPDEKPILLLGEWCRRFSRRNSFKGSDVAVVPYHWDDRGKLHDDFKYLSILYEELLKELTDCLNKIHKVNYSLRYWRVLVGPWLGHFVQVLFDRWAILESAIAKFEIDSVTLFNVNPTVMVPSDMDEYISLYVGDLWNQIIFNQLISNYTSLPVTNIDGHLDFFGSKKVKFYVIINRSIRGLMDKLARRFSSMFTRRTDAFFIATCLPRRVELSLHLALGQVPKLARRVCTPKMPVNLQMREWSIGGRENFQRDEFGFIVRDLIPQHLPMVYLEGYSALRQICRGLPWPSAPSVIFTSNAFSSDDVFKAWAAEKMEDGAPLVIGQHGGNYGMALWNYMEDHQIAIADKFLSWGWSRRNEPKIEPVVNLKMIGRSQDWDPNGGAVLTELTLPRYSYHMFSSPVASQWLNYFEDQCRFVRALPEYIRKQLTVRLYSDYGWDEAERWRDQFSDIQLDPGLMPLSCLTKRSRLSISTYNATTFLESLTLNVPTLVFWDPLYWELNDAALRKIQILKNVKIFHDSPEAAAAHSIEVWGDVEKWWFSDQVQEAREQFCATYSRSSENSVGLLKSVLESVMRKQEKVC